MSLEWTQKRHEEAEALFLSGMRGQALAGELSSRWGERVTPLALTKARLRWKEKRKALAAATPPPVAPTVGDDDTGEWEPVHLGEAEAPQAPAVHTSKTRGEGYLIISDTQEPYSAPGALKFILAVAREFNIDARDPGRVYHVGDEVDFLNFSRFPRSAEAPHTPNQELEALRERLRPWYVAIPHLRLCQSNHGDRILRRAEDAGLPSQVVRLHSEILQAPPGWQWAKDWRVDASRERFLVEHGHHGGQSTTAARQRPAWNAISTVWGHMHAQACVVHVRTHGQQVWGMCVGSMIDREAVAFKYGKPNTWQPWLGVGVVLDGGRTPVLVPYGSL